MSCLEFLNKHGGEILLAVSKVKQSMRNLSSIIAGRAITEQYVFFKKNTGIKVYKYVRPVKEKD